MPLSICPRQRLELSILQVEPTVPTAVSSECQSHREFQTADVAASLCKLWASIVAMLCLGHKCPQAQGERMPMYGMYD